MYLIIHHVLQSLIIRRSKEDLSIQLATSVSIIKYLHGNIRYLKGENFCWDDQLIFWLN